MTPAFDERSAARILDLAQPPRGSRSRALAGFAAILALAAHASLVGGFPKSAHAAAMSPAGAKVHARETAHMKRLMAIGAAAALSAGASAQNAVQWRVEDGGNGHWYGVQSKPIADMSWAQMRDAATSVGGHLITIANAAEDSFAFGYFVSLQRDMMGGPLGFYRSASGTWQWVTGEPAGYTNWRGPCCGNPAAPDNGPTQPFATWIGPEQQASIVGRWEDWSDAELGNPAQPFSEFMVEWDADCNNDGIVDFGQILNGSLPDGNGNNIPDCCESGVSCIAPVAQWRVEDGGNGHWYMLSWEVHPWPAARTRANQLGGYLATLTTAAERQFVLPLCDNHIDFDVWLGASRANAASPVQWVTGEPWSYAAWGPGSPNPNSPYDYLEMVGRSNLADFGLWNLELVYAWGPGQISLIEFDADCNNDGIVDYGQVRSGELLDANANNIPDCCEAGNSCNCPADTNNDGFIDGIDLATILTRWAQPAAKFPNADCNRDGVIDGADLALVLGTWGVCP